MDGKGGEKPDGKSDSFPDSPRAAAPATPGGRLRPGLLRQGRHAPFPVPADQLLQPDDPEASRLDLRRLLCGCGLHRHQGRAAGVSAAAGGLPGRKDRPDPDQVGEPLRQEHRHPAGNGPGTEGARDRRVL